MSYISSEDVKDIRDGIKKVFPSKEGWKFSVSRHHSSSACIALMKAPAKFEVDGNYQLNDFHPNIYDGNVRELIENLNLILDNVKECGDRNFGDMGADYPNYNYFRHYSLGKWDKKIEDKEGKVDWKTIKERVYKHIIKRELKK